MSRFQPAAHLRGRRRIPVQLGRTVREADVLFKNRRAFGDRELHRIRIIRWLVRGIADPDEGITCP